MTKTRIVLITGATAGIGEATAKRLAQAGGYRLIITGRRKDRLEILAEMLRKDYGTDVLPLCFDVRSEIEVSSTLGSLPKDWSEVDILINNAGLAAGLNPIAEGVLDDWERMIDTNIKGLLYVTHAILPSMKERKQGHIINISSIAGREMYPCGNVYSATKHAVSALTKGMRLDLLPYGIKVSQICPGAVETEFSIVRFHGDEDRASKVYEGFQPLKGEDVADAVYYSLSVPPHVCIDDLLIMPTAQASASMIHRESN